MKTEEINGLMCSYSDAPEIIRCLEELIRLIEAQKGLIKSRDEAREEAHALTASVKALEVRIAKQIIKRAMSDNRIKKLEEEKSELLQALEDKDKAHLGDIAKLHKYECPKCKIPLVDCINIDAPVSPHKVIKMKKCDKCDYQTEAITGKKKVCCGVTGMIIDGKCENCGKPIKED